MNRTLSLYRMVALGTVALIGTGAADAAQRTFVSTGGSDASAACSLAAPCRGFAKAITVTDAGGEVVVLDSGGYGGVTINKSVTITSPAGVYAGISVFAGQDGIVVGAGAGKVVLRGLTINGQGGNNGIRVQAGEVHVENVVVSNLAQAGIRVDGGTSVRLSSVVSRSNERGLVVTPANSLPVVVRDTELSANTWEGVMVATGAPGVAAQVTVERSTSTRNFTGFMASASGGATALLVVVQSVASENAGDGLTSMGAGATVFVRETAVTRNGTGLQQQSSGVLNACGSNLLVANGTAQSGTINVNAAACLDQVAGGTVTNVATGAGLTGGPISTTGTIGLAATNLLPTTACAANQVPQWNGSAWACASAGGTGTVTNVGTGTGLTGGPITTSGTIAADTTYLQRRVSATCAAGSSIRTINADGTVACEADDGTVTNVATGPGLTGGPITTTGTIAVNTAVIQARVTGSCPVGNYIRTIAADGTVTCQADGTGPANAFAQGGNAFGATATLGTTDNNLLQIVVNGAHVLRFEPNATSPNLIGGHIGNRAQTSSTYGATIAGGGKAGSDCWDPVANAWTQTCANDASDMASIGGGEGNVASANHATVGGGESNNAGASYGVISGGYANIASGQYATVGGGYIHRATAFGATVAGGYKHTASASNATVGGGSNNTASGSAATVGGGSNNTASGVRATVPGGSTNTAQGDFSFAAGQGANALANGCFVWADSTNVDFTCGVPDQFAVRATGGARFVTAVDGAGNATRAVSIDATGQVTIPIETATPNLALYQATIADYARLRLIRNGGAGTFWDIAAGTTSDVLNFYRQGSGNVMSLTPGGADLLLMNNGAHLTSAGVWTSVSDRNVKENFAPIDALDVLARVVALPVTQWNYKAEPGVKRIGPMAQDFHAAFGLGASDKTIGAVDADGIALAAIQGLNAKVEVQAATLAERDARIERQAREIDVQRVELSELRDRLAQVESLRGELAAIKSALATALPERTSVAVAAR
jgi:trimeric autotransporter adhesin